MIGRQSKEVLRSIRQKRPTAALPNLLAYYDRWAPMSTSAREVGSDNSKEDQKYCVQLVEKRDREGYLCGLLVPKRAQRSYFAIRAFNAELASIKDGSSLRRRGGGGIQQGETAATLAVQMRMQWWRDAVGTIYGDDPRNTSSDPTLANLSISCWHSPVVRALDRAVKENDLTRRFLERLIESREADLEINQYPTLEEAVNYAEQSVSSLLYLSLECAGVREDEADVVASHAGIGIGLTTCLRGTPFRLLQGEVPLPADLFPQQFPFDQLVESVARAEASSEEEKQDPRELLSQEDTRALDHAIREVAHEALAHLTEARNLQSQVPKAGRSCLLPVIPSLHYLWQLEQKSQHNVFDRRLRDTQRLSMLLWLGRTWLTGII